MAIDANQLKQKIDQSSILSDDEKKDWLFLLPKMRQEQLLELERILDVRVPDLGSRKSDVPEGDGSSSYGAGRSQTAEPKAQISDSASRHPSSDIRAPTSVPQHHTSVIHPRATPPMADGEGVHGEEAPVKPKETDVRRAVIASLPKGDEAIPEKGSPRGLEPLAMTTLSIETLRKAPSVYEFFDDLTARMILKIRNHEMTASELATGLQASPLYLAYVEAGRAMLEGRDPEALTRSEFEAIADFRASLKKILNSA